MYYAVWINILNLFRIWPVYFSCNECIVLGKLRDRNYNNIIPDFSNVPTRAGYLKLFIVLLTYDIEIIWQENSKSISQIGSTCNIHFLPSCISILAINTLFTQLKLDIPT
jgi:hypothetical protein